MNPLSILLKIPDETVTKEKSLNLMLVADKYHWELSHSKIIEWFLNYERGGKRPFMELFQNRIIGKLGRRGKSNLSSRMKVYRERGKIDLLLMNHNDRTAIIIENKVDAVDQPRQLWRYARRFREYDAVIAYLTVLGDEPSSRSKHTLLPEEIVLLSYEKDIFGMLNELRNSEQLGTKMWYEISDYMEVITNMANTDRSRDKITSDVFKAEGSRAFSYRDIISIEYAHHRYYHKRFMQEICHLFADAGVICAMSGDEEYLREGNYGIEIEAKCEAVISVMFCNEEAEKYYLYIGIRPSDYKTYGKSLRAAIGQKLKSWNGQASDPWYKWTKLSCPDVAYKKWRGKEIEDIVEVANDAFEESIYPFYLNASEVLDLCLAPE